jgi:hypothetical protein
MAAVTRPPTATTTRTPDRDTSEQELDQFNQWLRSQPWHQAMMRGRSSGLSRSEQSQLEQQIKANGIELPSGMHIDQGGNLNQKNRLGRNVGIAAAIGGGALTGLGFAGLGPLGGLGGAAGSAGAGAGGGLAAVEGGAFGLPAAAASALPGFVPASQIGAGLAGAAGGGAAAAGGAAGSAAPTAAAAGAGGGIPWGDIARVAIPAGVALGGRALAGGVDEDGTNGATVETDGQLSALLAETLRRFQAQGPLFDATNRQALAGLPTYAKRGGN